MCGYIFEYKLNIHLYLTLSLYFGMRPFSTETDSPDIGVKQHVAALQHMIKYIMLVGKE